MIDLAESRGFSARKSGDSFVDPTNPSDTATFDGLELLPKNLSAYETNSDLIKSYSKWKTRAEKTGSVFEINAPGATLRAAMIVVMSTSRGVENYVLFVKDLTRLEGKLTSIPPNVNPGRGGYVLNRTSSLSERSGLKPSDLIKTKKLYKPKDVAELLEPARATAGDQPVDQMQSYIQALVARKANNFVIKGGAEFASLHQKYLGEWAAPIALITGQFTPKDQLAKVEDAMLEGGNIKTGKISYNSNPSETLYDSMVTVGEFDILVSSKTHKSGGAAASLKGLQDTIVHKASSFPPRFWQNKKNAKFKSILETITSKSAVDGVLDLAAEESVISSADATKIRSLIAGVDATLTIKTQRLVDSYAANQRLPNYNPGYHALAAVAKALCERLNAEDYTDVAKAVLNHANILQMNFDVAKQGEDLLVKGFRLIWPSKFEGSVVFYPGKNFSATEVKGRLGFKLVKSGAQVDLDSEPDPSLVAPSVRSVNFAKRAQDAAAKVGKIVSPGQRDRRDLSVPDQVALGRTKKR